MILSSLRIFRIKQRKMSETVQEVTAQAVVEFTRQFMDVLAEKRGGDTTLNELRIMNVWRSARPIDPA